MTDKRKVRSTLRFLQHVRTWQLCVILILCAFLAATFLRLNNIGMTERRSAVIAADEAGDSAVTQQRLFALQRYVNSHMNADPGRIAFIGQHQRDSQKLKDEAASQGASDGNVYQKAAAVCDPIARAQNWRWPDPRYTQCVDTELSKYPAASGPVMSIKVPNVSMYYHSYVSPSWSPDFAGFSILVCIVIALMIIVRLGSLLVLRLLLKQHYKSV